MKVERFAFVENKSFIYFSDFVFVCWFNFNFYFSNLNVMWQKVVWSREIFWNCASRKISFYSSNWIKINILHCKHNSVSLKKKHYSWFANLFHISFQKCWKKNEFKSFCFKENIHVICKICFRNISLNILIRLKLIDRHIYFFLHFSLLLFDNNNTSIIFLLITEHTYIAQLIFLLLYIIITWCRRRIERNQTYVWMG
jgi:hypothetical protein